MKGEINWCPRPCHYITITWIWFSKQVTFFVKLTSLYVSQVMEPNLLCFILFTLFGFVITSFNDRNGTQHYTYCVLGAGPAGLQMAHFLSKARRDYIVLERNSGPGSFFNKWETFVQEVVQKSKLRFSAFCFETLPFLCVSRYPRHRKLISINKIHTGRRNREFNLRHDWNSLLSDKPDLLFRRVSAAFYPPADTFPLYLSMFVKELGLRVQYGVDIGRVRFVQSASKRSYILTDQHASEYTCRYMKQRGKNGLWVTLDSNLSFSPLASFLWPQVYGFLKRLSLSALILLRAMSPSPPTLRTTETRPCSFWGRGTLLLKRPRASWVVLAWCTCSVPVLFDLPGRHITLAISGKAWCTVFVSKLCTKRQEKTYAVLPLFPFRAVNNELIDTYQLKSLSGLVEAPLEKIVIAERKTQSRRRPDGKEGRRKLYLTLKKYTLNNNQSNGDVAREELPGYHIDNFPMRKPYDRVIRCLGFRFNFSIFDR